MGNETSSSSDTNEFIREFKIKYDFQTEISDKRFGDVYVYKHKMEKRYIGKRGHMCNSAPEYQTYLRSCKQRMNLKHRNILMLYYAHEANEDNICGDFNKITIYFEYYFHDLEKELNRRRENGLEFFSESELWYLLDSLIQACCYFEKNKIYHGDIRPTNILLTPEGQVKIADHGILHADHSNYYKMLSRREKCYLSPILVRSLGVGEFKPFHDHWKSDVYSLGMTLLEAASLCPPLCAYDFENYQISHPILEELLNQCRAKYSDFFVNVIRDMLLDDENTRPSFENLRALLLPFQNSIQSNQQLQRNSVVYQNPILVPVQLQQSQAYMQPQQQIIQLPQQQQLVTPLPQQAQQQQPNQQFQAQNSVVTFVQQPLSQTGTSSVTAFQAQDGSVSQQQMPLQMSNSPFQPQVMTLQYQNGGASFGSPQQSIIQYPVQRLVPQQPMQIQQQQVQLQQQTQQSPQLQASANTPQLQSQSPTLYQQQAQPQLAADNESDITKKVNEAIAKSQQTYKRHQEAFQNQNVGGQSPSQVIQNGSNPGYNLNGQLPIQQQYIPQQYVQAQQQFGGASPQGFMQQPINGGFYQGFGIQQQPQQIAFQQQ
ncbi:hypothetical protein ABPG74_017116 [Tetrahymena malaccensis]